MPIFEEGGNAMYPVSDAFMDAVESNTRKYYWTGTIVTKNKKAYSFGTGFHLSGDQKPRAELVQKGEFSQMHQKA